MSFQYEGFLGFLVRTIIETIFPPSENELLVLKATRDEVARLMAPKSVILNGLGNSLTVTALLPYRIPLIQALVLEAKFENNHHAQALLGSVLAHYIKVSVENAQNVVLVPLPLGAKRRKERGYNQIEEIARYAQHQLKLQPVPLDIGMHTDLLVRTRETLPQTSLDREARLLNIRGAFGAAPRVSFPLDSSRLYVLLDDVVTTGATLSAAHEALTKVGAKQVLLLALAH